MRERERERERERKRDVVERERERAEIERDLHVERERLVRERESEIREINTVGLYQYHYCTVCHYYGIVCVRTSIVNMLLDGFYGRSAPNVWLK